MTRPRVIVTGGAGFIGAHFVRDLLAAEPTTEVVILDKMTYAGNAPTIEAIVHFAAETHVDRSRAIGG